MGMGVICHKLVKQGYTRVVGGNNNFLVSTKTFHVHGIDLKTKLSIILFL